MCLTKVSFPLNCGRLKFTFMAVGFFNKFFGMNKAGSKKVQSTLARQHKHGVAGGKYKVQKKKQRNEKEKVQRGEQKKIVKSKRQIAHSKGQTTKSKEKIIKKVVVKKTTKKLVGKAVLKQVKPVKQVKKAAAKPVIETTKSEKVTTKKSLKAPKAYEAKLVEQKLYRMWEEGGYFQPKTSRSGKRFVISMPPPNITSNLHIGHASALTFGDIMIRFHRMLGEETLWVPGTDHAGIATQYVVERKLTEQGKTKEALGREEFIKQAWEWKKKYGGIIVEQIRRMGASCDWSRERFTLDEGLSRAVRHAFVELYKKDLIYKGDYLVNWCSHCKSVISDDEVEYRKAKGKLWYIRYFIKAADKSVVVATTRPETMLGDTAVVVHPDDKRYREVHGKLLILPITNREIPLITDRKVDPEFGTGAVKVTPAHDPTDYALGLEHKLEMIQVIGKDGKMTKEAGKYRGMPVLQARRMILEHLDQIGNLEKAEPYEYKVGTCYRCQTVIEPLVSKQWFVKTQPLAELALKAVNKKELEFTPERFEKIYRHWMENIRDWCISRQLWWGHPIPAWYCEKCGEMYVAEEAPRKCVKAKCKKAALVQDKDVLDTWFSSALWPFSTLGWPLKTDDLAKYYPNAVMETGYDIIFFWVARMVMLGMHFMKTVPFKTVYLHGMVRDEQGRKMSKSLDNGIDPIEMIEKYGTDALRLSLVLGNTAGNDLNYAISKLEGYRNFVNKLWNASRYIRLKTSAVEELSRLEDFLKNNFKKLDPTSRWILTDLNQLIEEVTSALQGSRFSEGGLKLYDFVWKEFCDRYIEANKFSTDKNTNRVLQYVILILLKLLHPYIPFVTEEIWSYFKQPKLLIVSSWPRVAKELKDEAITMETKLVFEIIHLVRNLKAEKGVGPTQKVKLVLYGGKTTGVLEKNRELFLNLAKLSSLKIKEQGPELEQSAVASLGEIQILLLLKGLDRAKEQIRLNQELEKKKTYLASLNKKLKSKEFLKKAPKKVVSEHRARLKNVQKELNTLEKQWKEIRK